MKSFMKAKLVTTLFLFVFFLSGCLWDPIIYEGEYPELFTEAIHSIVNTNGIKYDGGEYLEIADIEVLQQDDQGRILFSYYEANEISTYNLLVCQSSDEENVYFYADINFISSSEDDFLESDIQQLLEVNDWNKELNIDNAVSVKIVHEKEDAPIDVDDETFEILLNHLADSTGYLGEYYLYSFSEYMTCDDYGRALFYVYGFGRDVYGDGVSPDSVDRRFDAIVIINPDGTYFSDASIMELSDFYNYQQDIITFKTVNHWNEEID